MGHRFHTFCLLMIVFYSGRQQVGAQVYSRKSCGSINFARDCVNFDKSTVLFSKNTSEEDGGLVNILLGVPQFEQTRALPIW